MVRRTVALLALALLATACSASGKDDARPVRVAPPEVGECRDLTAKSLERPDDDSAVVPCREQHTAQTFAVGRLPDTDAAYDDPRHGRHVFDACTPAFRDFLGVDESLALRVRLSWAWFRPSEPAWEKGARWYRCDVVGGPDHATRLRDLPAEAEGLFGGAPPDEWLTCARGATVAAGEQVPCSEPHDWRAVSTIKVGRPDEPYPGDRIVQVRSRDQCSRWVGAWTHYAPGYDYGFTWFHEAEWTAGNRRSVCWARTDS